MGSVAKGQATIASITITKNEEKNIRACLDSLRWVDEMVVVDAESTDRTVELAKMHTPHVHVRAWTGYGPQKNFAMEQATADWILIVDADERVSEELRNEILALLQEPGASAAYRISRRNYYYGGWIRGAGQYPDPQLRLVRRGRGLYNDLPVEERIRHGKPGASWYHLIFNPMWTFVKFYVFRDGYRDGLPGFIVSGFSAAHVLLKYAKLWERAHTA